MSWKASMGRGTVLNRTTLETGREEGAPDACSSAIPTLRTTRAWRWRDTAVAIGESGRSIYIYGSVYSGRGGENGVVKSKCEEIRRVRFFFFFRFQKRHEMSSLGKVLHARFRL